MKELAEKWAEDFWKSEQGKAYIEEINKEFRDYILLGKPTSCLNEELLKEIKDYGKH